MSQNKMAVKTMWLCYQGGQKMGFHYSDKDDHLKAPTQKDFGRQCLHNQLDNTQDQGPDLETLHFKC